MGFLQMVQLFLGLLPSIMQTVQLVEKAIPQSGQGPAKLNMVLSTVQAAAQAAPAIAGGVSDIKDAAHAGDAQALSNGLTHIISSVVSLFNQAGVFQKSALVQNAAPLSGAPAEQTVFTAPGAGG